MPTRIGLFGGTFDPVHNGHISISDSFLASGFIDELWVLLTPYPPHKKENGQTSYEIRRQMVEAAFKGKEHVGVSTVEKSLPSPSYSVQTIRHLKQQYPDHDFYFCMGEDSLASFDTWKYYDEILYECDLLVARRPGETHQGVEQRILEHTHFVEHTPLDISSSTIREHVRKGIPIQKIVPPEVAKIIEKEQLYS